MTDSIFTKEGIAIKPVSQKKVQKAPKRYFRRLGHDVNQDWLMIVGSFMCLSVIFFDYRYLDI